LIDTFDIYHTAGHRSFRRAAPAGGIDENVGIEKGRSPFVGLVPIEFVIGRKRHSVAVDTVLADDERSAAFATLLF
jgi:hypothetical protein